MPAKKEAKETKEKETAKPAAAKKAEPVKVKKVKTDEPEKEAAKKKKIEAEPEKEAAAEEAKKKKKPELKKEEVAPVAEIKPEKPVVVEVVAAVAEPVPVLTEKPLAAKLEVPELKKAKEESAEIKPTETYWGTGRRKTAVAQVRLVSGKGKILVNGILVAKYFGRKLYESMIKEPLKLTQTLARFDVIATVAGGGVNGQAGAVRHGISRALLQYDPEYRKMLRTEGFLTRDPRMKERKKYGQKGARKRFQFSKR
jgi:small subunit ribosomal protein S9